MAPAYVINGDSSITARVVSISGVSNSAKVGVMIRDTVASGSKEACTLITPGELAAPAISLSGQASRLTFHTVYGRVYQLQYSHSLNPTNWQNIGPPQTGTAGVMILSDPSPGGPPQRFYHILIQP